MSSILPDCIKSPQSTLWARPFQGGKTWGYWSNNKNVMKWKKNVVNSWLVKNNIGFYIECFDEFYRKIFVNDKFVCVSTESSPSRWVRGWPRGRWSVVGTYSIGYDILWIIFVDEWRCISFHLYHHQLVWHIFVHDRFCKRYILHRNQPCIQHQHDPLLLSLIQF